MIEAVNNGGVAVWIGESVSLNCIFRVFYSRGMGNVTSASGVKVS